MEGQFARQDLGRHAGTMGRNILLRSSFSTALGGSNFSHATAKGCRDGRPISESFFELSTVYFKMIGAVGLKP